MALRYLVYYTTAVSHTPHIPASSAAPYSPSSTVLRPNYASIRLPSSYRRGPAGEVGETPPSTDSLSRALVPMERVRMCFSHLVRDASSLAHSFSDLLLYMCNYMYVYMPLDVYVCLCMYMYVFR